MEPQHFPGPPCTRCGGTLWRNLTMPVFRVDECVRCHSTRASTDSGSVRGDSAAVPTVFVVRDLWAGVIGVYASRELADRAIESRQRMQGPANRYVVESFEVQREHQGPGSQP